MARVTATLPIGGVWGVTYYDARTGRRLPDCDPQVGPVYLERMAHDGGEDGEIAVATRQDADGGTWCLLPGAHAWTREIPEVLRDR